MEEATPASGMTLHDVADKLYEQAMQEEATPAEPSEDVENTIEATEEVEEVEAEPVETEPVEAEDTSEIDTFLSDLNDHFKEDTSHFDAIKVPTKVNGVEGEATLSELLATHQIGEASTERLESLKADRAAFESERQSKVDSFNEQLNQAAGLVQGLEKQFTNQFEQIDWNELRQTDPAEYAARQQEKAQVEQQLNNYKSQIQQTYSEQFQNNVQETVQRESSRILERIPEWKNSELYQKESSELRSYLLNNEFAVQDIDGVVENGVVKSIGLVDSRLVNLARKAMLYDMGKKEINVAKKKVAKVPKVVRPGKPDAPVEQDVKARQAKRARLRKSGSIDDFAAILYDDLKEG